MKAVILCRVSSKEQEETGYSLDSQKKLLTEYADKNAFKILKVYSISESASGKKLRKTFNEVLQFASKNNINSIFCEKIDRLTRNLKDAAIVDDWVKESPARSVHFVKENFILNTQTKAHDNLVWDMKVAIARFYANNLSEEVKKGQKEKIAQGWLPIRPPLGYKSTGEKGHITQIIDEAKAPRIIKMYELYSTGNYSLEALTKIMKEDGLRGDKNQPVSKTTLHRLLSNHFYYGKNEWMGKLYDGKQEPLVTKELFDMVQQKLSAKFGGHPRYRKHFPVFKAKIKCKGCGGIISWESQKGHWYGHCNHYRDCTQKKWVKQYEVEEQLFPILAAISPAGKNILKVLHGVLEDGHSDEVNYNTNKREEFNKIIRTADQRIEGAYKDKLDGGMPPMLCEKIIKESTGEKEEAIASLAKLTESRYTYYQAAIFMHELALNTIKIYENENATTEERRLLLSKIFSNLYLDEGKLEVKFTPGAEFLAKWAPTPKNIFEPVILQDKTDLLGSVCTTKRGRRDLNPRAPP